VPTVTVTFDSNGGDAPSISSMDVLVGEAYGTLATATHPSGYQFAGWFTGQLDGTETFAATTVTGTTNRTLYARWVNWSPQSSAIVTNTAAAGSPGIILNAAAILPAGANGPALTYGASQPGFSFNAGTRALSANAGTQVAFYSVPLTLAVGGHGTINRAVNVELRQSREYWFDEGTGSTNDWDNRGGMLKTEESQDYFASAARSVIGVVKVMYVKREGVGIEQPSYAQSIDAKILVRAYRSYDSGNNNNWLKTWLDVAGMSRLQMVTQNSDNPGGGQWKTMTKTITGFPRGGTNGTRAELGFEANFQYAWGMTYRVAWARLDIVWAP
jgi:uncharacterized repeat protein (TIGR02543 family)